MIQGGIVSKLITFVVRIAVIPPGILKQILT